MRTSTKVVIWAACVLAIVGVWQAVIWYRANPSPSNVYEAVIVQVSGCKALDFNICRTVVDMEGARLSRPGNHGEVGDTVLIYQSERGVWTAPSPSRLRKYLAEQGR